MTYWDQEKVRQAWTLYGAGVDRLALFAADFTADGDLTTSAFNSLSETLADLKANRRDGQKFLLAIVNDIRAPKPFLKNAGIIHAILSDPIRRERHIAQILELSRDFDGVEIDYESLSALDKDRFSAFIVDLAAKLHARGQILTVDVEAKTRDISWNGTAADWSAIASAADVLQVMAYYEHFPGGLSGPVASEEWIRDVATYGLSRVPAEKLGFILALNGVDWPAVGKGKTIDFELATQLAAKNQAGIRRSNDDEIPNYTYKVERVRHTVWYEDDRSLRRKVDLLKGMAITHLGLWRLGSGDPVFWRSFAEKP